MPDGLLRVLRVATEEFLDEKADQLAAMGDTSYRRVVESQREYFENGKAYFDYGDINQGLNETPSFVSGDMRVRRADGDE